MLLAAAIMVALGVFISESVGYGESLNARLQDRLMEPHPAMDDIVIVAIDDVSIQQFGVWPWPRTLHADMIDRLSDYGAKVIGYDVTFAESSTEEADARLAEAIANSGRVVLAAEAKFSEEKPVDVSDLDRMGSAVWISDYLHPKQQFADVAADYGVTTLLTDPDGIVRRAAIDFSTEDPTFAADVASDFQARTHFLSVSFQRIGFAGPPGAFKKISFANVLLGDVGREAFEGKIVLVGATASDLHDEHLTPFGGGVMMSGVEVQANIIQSILENRFYRTFGPLETALAYLVLAVLFVLFASFLRLRYVVIITAGLSIAYLLLALGLSSAGILAPMLGPATVLVLITAIDVVYRYWTEKQQKRWVQDAFGRYLAPQVIDKLIKGETELKLGGIKKELTIMFSDIRGFTSLSEKLTPEALVAQLNEYLTVMTGEVLKSEGTLDKFIGDAVMAFWGAPIEQKDGASRAAGTALSMKKRLSELCEKWRREGKPEFAIGVGMNTGHVIVGNMGAEQRFDYTVIGDDVNLASRLEGQTKTYGVMILATESTKNKLGDGFVTRRIDLIAVKGKKKPVWIFEVMDFAGNRKAEELSAEFGKAVELYQGRNWEGAQKIFGGLAVRLDDKPSKLYVERCEAMKKNPPPADWDGAFVATSK